MYNDDMIEERPTPLIPLCHKCSEKIIQQDMLDKAYDSIVGCQKLTGTQWEEGQKQDNKEGPYYQHNYNCPYLKEKQNEVQS